jgi:hypothetical protein
MGEGLVWMEVLIVRDTRHTHQDEGVRSIDVFF